MEKVKEGYVPGEESVEEPAEGSGQPAERSEQPAEDSGQ